MWGSEVSMGGRGNSVLCGEVRCLWEAEGIVSCVGK